MAKDGRYAGNAGAISGDGQRRTVPELQEQFPAIATDGPYAGNAGAISGDCLRRPVPEMQEQFRSDFRE